MSHKPYNMSHLFRLVGALVLAGTCTTAWASPITARAAASEAGVQQGFSINLCKINGKLVKPPVGSWSFILNFDHATSTSVAKGCLAEQQAGSASASYTSKDCVVVNVSAGGSVFGGGNGLFGGNAYLQCNDLPTTPSEPDGFGVRANAQFPNPSRMHTLVSSTPFSFTVRTNAACGLTLSSRYNNGMFQSNTNGLCGVFTQLETSYSKPPAPVNGRHWKGNTLIGAASFTSVLGFTAPFAISIGAPGEEFTLDWILIDPPRSSGDT